VILSKEVKIRLNYNNKKHFEKLGYDINNKFVDVKVEHLNKGSHAILNIKCDICGVEKNLQYNAYLKYLSRSIDNKYRCGKCNQINRKNTNIEKYGEDSPIKIKEFIEKRNKTIIEKYGVDHPCKNEIVKNKIKKTNIEKYGVEYVLESSEIREKINKTNLEKYGNINSLVGEKTLEKTHKKMIEKYEVKYSMSSQEIKNKIIENGRKTRIEKILMSDQNIIDPKLTFFSLYILYYDQNI
jgi:hypothetical protein